MSFKSAESETDSYHQSGIRARTNGTFTRDVMFYNFWIGFREDTVIGESAARAAFAAGWDSAPPATDASADAPTPLTDAELDEIERWVNNLPYTEDHIVGGIAIRDENIAKRNVNLLIAEIRRSRKG